MAGCRAEDAGRQEVKPALPSPNGVNSDELRERLQLAQIEADRTGRPVIVSAARGLIATPKVRIMHGGPVLLSVYTGPHRPR